jgi:hypothetical protein
MKTRMNTGDNTHKPGNQVVVTILNVLSLGKRWLGVLNGHKCVGDRGLLPVLFAVYNFRLNVRNRIFRCGRLGTQTRGRSERLSLICVAPRLYRKTL